jgi:hypothetical protein
LDRLHQRLAAMLTASQTGPALSSRGPLAPPLDDGPDRSSGTTGTSGSALSGSPGAPRPGGSRSGIWPGSSR